MTIKKHLSEGSMYIDVDMDSHSVVSLSGDKDTEKQYMMSAGMISSLYESTVWEQITGYESVSILIMYGDRAGYEVACKW